MPARPVLVLCEGPHDIAFLTRLLAVACKAAPIESPVAELQPPFGALFAGRLAARNANNATLRGSGPVAPDDPPLLEAVLRMSDNSIHWFFLNCCGDSRAKQINAFLKLVLSLTTLPDTTKLLDSLGVVFVNDADEKGVAGRQKIIIDNHSAMLGPLISDFPKLGANTVVRNGKYGVGTCVFAKPGTEEGTLEDIVWKLWKADDISRQEQSLALMKSLAIAGTKIGPGSVPSKILKAAMTTAGQTECPGYSLGVILRETTALDTEKMKVDTECKRFVEVLTTV